MATSSTMPPVLTKQNAESLTLFQCLGFVSAEDAAKNTAELQRRYRRKSLLFHPDKDSSPEARLVFERLKLAVETLSDVELTRVYLASLQQTSAETDALRKAGEAALAAEDALRRREWAAAERAANVAAAKQQRDAAAASMHRAMTASYNDLEDTIVAEWDVDEEMLRAKLFEVSSLLSALTSSAAVLDSKQQTQKRPRAADSYQHAAT